MTDIPEALRSVLAERLDGTPAGPLRASVERLMAAYRSERSPAVPIMVGPVDVAAYAAYRMPATYAAVRAALSQAALAPALPAPQSLLDIGGGTGAAAWAAVTAFPSITTVTVLDQVAPALAFGAALAHAAPVPALREAAWTSLRLPGALPAADLVTLSYVLGELPGDVAGATLDAAAHAARVLAVVEPGTPAGYARIRMARARLIGAGWRIAAPCPHQHACPITGGDWCHFAARVNRSGLHRRIKDAELGYEDEKFSYVVAVRPPDEPEPGDPADGGLGVAGLADGGPADGGPADGGPAEAGAREPFRPQGGRVLRHPAVRKGMVTLRLCRPDGTIADRIVARSHGTDYRAARAVSWGGTL